MAESDQREHNGLRFVIQEDDPSVGVYLYIYEGAKCIRDYLQNDVETCIKIAFEDYGVPHDRWTAGKAN